LVGRRDHQTGGERGERHADPPGDQSRGPVSFDAADLFSRSPWNDHINWLVCSRARQKRRGRKRPTIPLACTSSTRPALPARVGLTPSIYEEVWVAGKAMYKLEPVVASGGELIIHGPHVKAISFMHGQGDCARRLHVRDYFVKQWDRFAHESKLILAHSTNVKGIGTFENGTEFPRITGDPGHQHPQRKLAKASTSIIAMWARSTSNAGRMDEDTLVVEEAGQVLYRLKGWSRLGTGSVPQ